MTKNQRSGWRSMRKLKTKFLPARLKGSRMIKRNGKVWAGIALIALTYGVIASAILSHGNPGVDVHGLGGWIVLLFTYGTLSLVSSSIQSALNKCLGYRSNRILNELVSTVGFVIAISAAAQVCHLLGLLTYHSGLQLVVFLVVTSLFCDATDSVSKRYRRA